MQEVWHHASLHHKFKKSGYSAWNYKNVCINHWSKYQILPYTHGIWSTIWNADIGNLNTQGPESIKTHTHTHTTHHTILYTAHTQLKDHCVDLHK
jgi:hypothetical protein